MTTARVFKSGNSQAVYLPKEFRFASAEVEIFRRGDEVVLRERPVGSAHVFDLLAALPDDMAAPKELPQQRRGLDDLLE